MTPRRIVAACLVLLLPAVCLRAQQPRVEVSAAGSYMMPNTTQLAQWGRGAAGLEAAVWPGSPQLDGRRSPYRLGVKGSFLYIHDGVTGHRLALAGALRAPLWHRVDYTLALGAALYTKPHCLTLDPDNQYIGHWLSFHIDLGLSYSVTDRLALSASFLHNSNGNIYRPNKGLNYLQVGMTYALLPASSPLRSEVLPRPVHTPGHEVGFTLSHGIVTSRHLMQQGYYPCYDLALNYLYRLTPVLAVGATADLWYNYSHTWQLPLYHDRYPLPVYLGLQAAAERHWGPLSLRVGLGGIALASTRIGIRLYERVGVYYNWGDHYAGVGLNARLGMIEFVECGYGMRLPLGKG